MLEIELKAKLTPSEALSLPGLAHGLGFREEYACRERDVYYNSTERDFAVTDEALRVREHTQDGQCRACVTYKGPKQGSAAKARVELETGVESADTLRAILAALGFCPTAEVRKARRGYVGSGPYQGLCLCLDEAEGLGPYLELEAIVPDDAEEALRAAAEQRLLDALDALGLPRSRLTTASYLELLLSRGQG